MTILDGKAIAARRRARLKETILKHAKRPPALAVILVGNHPASEVYVRGKLKAAEEVGIKATLISFPETVTQEKLLSKIEELNKDPSVDGILVQTPLPPHLSLNEVMLHLSPQKDIDGFHPLNVGKLLSGEKEGFISCTPLGILRMLEEEKISLSGKEVVIVGRSSIVGKPLAALLLQPGIDATVTVAHSKTPHLGEVTKRADILIAAVGKPHLITKEMVKKGAIVIDVGITRNGQKLVGDVDFDQVKEIASRITPVPGGVGPMTIAALLENCYLAYVKCASSS